ncbi:MAG: endonuclease/exonuclease/phosphatase family protein [Sterolibacteriaceae bacterium]|nr:endonuclease/exonuclease/phosphatase family protein [Sterolibacteriaceae bacterium]MBK9086103.1 endonuclease/exonuclease/phosphatase family protein [Sterolibacteriaceae bacterium]
MPCEPTLFSVLSWNIEHFRGGDARLKKVAAHIAGQNPDVFGLLEIEHADVLTLMQRELPDYDFALTDGPEVQEILVGWRRGKFGQTVFSQKREFNVGNPALRPGALLSVRVADTWYNMLFLHTDSGTDAPAFGNRAEMFGKTWKLKRALDRKMEQAAAAQLLVMGDLNTMGLMYPRPAKKFLRVDAPSEIAALDEAALKSGMRLLPKDQPFTWNGSAGKSNLDHVLASQALQLRNFGSDAEPAEIRVTGWPQLSGAQLKSFLAEISDHASLYAEVIG